MGKKCSWCWKNAHEVEQMIEGPNNIAICDECVRLCMEIIEEKKQPAHQDVLRTLVEHELKK